ncbi:unnamed protein product (macronuclear) [Paramecium tetraurelia]|uniref:Radial spoke protein 3 n=1 Tax=Paramecium tetraurelia TaxID=5888 RepID=A0E7K2_PARTE|nr:uncharacterized protein GSPATT00023997001 [Paramecium tetraurelia]CAK91269.1 unnamed protein product [Paramecium tetraurelia]|eukprot:XP_001458666.1 hypothetical protein (macronuclear) [Paramecium tetraurelia strain d4-2]
MATELLQENYEFNAPPRVVQKMKYREDRDACNIMWDKRVIRGNTYSSVLNKSEPTMQTTIKRIQNTKVVTEKKEDETIHDEETQTDPNVEELTDKPPRHLRETQTEFVIEKVVPRLYMREKTGIDEETQVWDDGELFNFEYEADTHSLSIGQKNFGFKSNGSIIRRGAQRDEGEQMEMAEQDRLERKEQQLYNENIKLKQQFHNQKQRDIKTHEKLVSRASAKKYLSKCVNLALQQLDLSGYFRDPVEIQLISEYLPWIYQDVTTELLNSNHILVEYNQMLDNIDDNMFQLHTKTLSKERSRRQSILDERERQRIAKEEADAQRRERRKIRLEKERRQKLKETVYEQMITKGEEKEWFNLISDVDGYYQGTNTIGYLGGIIGQFVIIINALQQVGETIEDISELITNSIAALPEGTIIEVGLRDQIDQMLADIEPELTLANLPEQLTQGIENAIKSNIVYSLQQHWASFGFLQNVNQIIDLVIKNLFENRPKVKWSKIKGQVDFQKIPCLVKLLPGMESLRFHPKSGKTRVEKQVEDEATEEEIINPQNLGEAVVDTKATAFIPQNEEIQTAVIHNVAEFHLRNLIIQQIGEQDIPWLVNFTDKCQQLETQIIEILNPQLPQLEVQQY